MGRRHRQPAVLPAPMAAAAFPAFRGGRRAPCLFPRVRLTPSSALLEEGKLSLRSYQDTVFSLPGIPRPPHLCFPLIFSFSSCGCWSFGEGPCSPSAFHQAPGEMLRTGEPPLPLLADLALARVCVHVCVCVCACVAGVEGAFFVVVKKTHR